MVSFSAEVQIFIFWPKTIDYIIIRRIDQKRGHFLWSFYSTVEGAMKLKFGSFCSS